MLRMCKFTAQCIATLLPTLTCGIFIYSYLLLHLFLLISCSKDILALNFVFKINSEFTITSIYFFT